jgi:hypothetical protein
MLSSRIGVGRGVTIEGRGLGQIVWNDLSQKKKKKKKKKLELGMSDCLKKYILGKFMVLIEFIWLRIGTDGRHVQTILNLRFP